MSGLCELHWECSINVDELSRMKCVSDCDFLVSSSISKAGL